MGLIEFAFGATTGVAGNIAYDNIKMVLGKTFGKLEKLANEKDKESFKLVLETLIDSNYQIKQQLEALQQGKKIVQVQQNHSGSGDNVAGNKVVGTQKNEF